MPKQGSPVADVVAELKHLCNPPRLFLKSLTANGLISVAFFLASLLLGTYNTKLLPIAAAILLLWTLADASISNQIVFNKTRATTEIKRHGTYKRYFMVNNITVAILSIPITLLFGLLLVAIVGKWSEVLYGLTLGLTMIWGWLGISNVMSVVLPFEAIKRKDLRKSRRASTRYIVLYCLPWVMLPVYAVLISLPFIFLGWTSGSSAQEHKYISALVILGFSLMLWWTGLVLADRQANHPNNKLKKYIDIAFK